MFNQATLIGYVGRDPEIRAVPSGDKVANFSLATSEKWKSNGEAQERTEWHRVVVWGPLADVVEKYIRKGASLLVQGQITTRKYTDAAGVEKQTNEIVVRGFGGTIKMLGGKGDAHGGTAGATGASASAAAARYPAPTPAKPASGWDDDDIPF